MADRLDLRTLRYFVAVAEEGSLRRAAERLHVSQPPLTRCMSQLERLVGRPLLVRGNRGVALTPAGRLLRERARRLLAEADALLLALRAGDGEAPPLVIGTSIGVAPGVLRAMLRAWRGVAGGARLEARTGSSPQLAAELRKGSLAFAVLAQPVDAAGLRCQPLYSEPLVVALHRGHPAARKKRVRLADLAPTTLFWNPRAFNPPFHDACARVFREAGFRPRIETVEPGQLLTLERIGQGEGFTLVNRWRTPVRVAGVVYRPLAEGERLAIRFVAAWPEAADGGEAWGSRLAAAARRAVAAQARASRPTRPAPGRRG